MILYGVAGFGYIITATFLPVIARQALPGSPWPDLFWPLFGLAVIPGAAHAVPYSAPAELARVVEAFLAATPDHAPMRGV